MSERFRKVTILSYHPDKHGRSWYGKSGEGIILSDDPDNVWITIDGKSIGAWPVTDTNIPALREDKKTEQDIDESSYEYLINKLTQQGIDPALVVTENDVVAALVGSDGRYLRLPTREEYALSWEELSKKGLVREDGQD